MPAPSPAARPLIKPPPTHRFAPGSRILARDEEWIVRTARQTRFGATSVQVTGISELVRGHDAVFLSDLDDLVELKPEETLLVQDPSPQYRRSRLYLESLLRQSPPTEPHLVMGHLGAMDVKEYQLVPAARALQQPRARILIADAVGLGKTIETGILLSELIARGRGRRILVVALKSVLEQFQEELWARFTIPLVRLDSVGIERVRRNIPANMNPFQKFDRVIISVDTLKKDAKYRRFLEACHWDVTVIDECQHVAVRGASATAGKTPSKAALKAGMSQRARLAKLLARTCDSLILTSATPHDGKPESFASLINLLEPTAVANESDYTADEIRGLYVRRFKKDIAAEAGDAFSERKVHAHHIPATPAEDAVLEGLRTAQFKTLRARGAGHGVLFRTTLLKGYLSPPRRLAAPSPSAPSAWTCARSAKTTKATPVPAARTPCSPKTWPTTAPCSTSWPRSPSRAPAPSPGSSRSWWRCSKTLAWATPRATSAWSSSPSASRRLRCWSASCARPPACPRTPSAPSTARSTTSSSKRW
ncbi:MAG: DEAD/DEAH box helicase [Sandaracinaceae bacterium]|nr:DEAD/DEAH box helicase [Sandaracinaceae bacterium]